jgi:hypothetical protein
VHYRPKRAGGGPREDRLGLLQAGCEPRAATRASANIDGALFRVRGV